MLYINKSKAFLVQLTGQVSSIRNIEYIKFSMVQIKYFLYLFFLHSVCGMCIFYLNENFNKSFSVLSKEDILRGIVIGLIMFSYTVLIGDMNSRFPEISKRTKTVLLFTSLFITMITVLFLINI